LFFNEKRCNAFVYHCKLLKLLGQVKYQLINRRDEKKITSGQNGGVAIV